MKVNNTRHTQKRVIVKQFSSPGALFKSITKKREEKKRHVLRFVFNSVHRTLDSSSFLNKKKKPRGSNSEIVQKKFSSCFVGRRVTGVGMHSVNFMEKVISTIFFLPLTKFCVAFCLRFRALIGFYWFIESPTKPRRTLTKL